MLRTERDPKKYLFFEDAARLEAFLDLILVARPPGSEQAREVGLTLIPNQVPHLRLGNLA